MRTFSTTDDSLLAAEAALRRAQLASDVAELDRLVDEELVFTGPDGALYAKADDLEAHGSGMIRINRLEPSEERIQRFGNIAVISVRMDGRSEAQTQLHLVFTVFMTLPLFCLSRRDGG